MSVFDPTICTLGEGPLWHPKRNVLFWFDIVKKRLIRRQGDDTQSWQFDECYSAAGWVDLETLILASETALWRFDITSGDRVRICDLERDSAINRSNDGRADPWGGFWIGTMGKSAESYAGAIYRYHKGELRKLVDKVTVSNTICFSSDQCCAYYADTISRRIMRQPLDAETGWPEGPPTVFVDLRPAELNPDGAVTDASGNLWVAMWGASCVVCFGPDGQELRRIETPALQPTCPAFGGPDLSDLYVTSATQALSDDQMAAAPNNGQTFVFHDIAQGLPEPQVIL